LFLIADTVKSGIKFSKELHCNDYRKKTSDEGRDMAATG